jgi:hypothetical protein
VVPVPAGGQDTQLEQFREMQAKLDEEAGRLVQLRQYIEQEWQAEHLPEERVIGPETSSAVSLTMPGQGCPGLQRGRPESSCSGDATPNNAGAIHHRGTAYPGRTQGSPGRCRSPTSRELCLPKARVPLGASCNALPTRVGGLDPHRAHTGRDAHSPGLPRRRAAPPRPSSPPRREGAPRLPPQARRTLRQ